MMEKELLSPEQWRQIHYDYFGVRTIWTREAIYFMVPPEKNNLEDIRIAQESRPRITSE